MPAEIPENGAYSKSFAPIADLVRTVRALSLVQEWHKVDGCWYRRIELTDTLKGEYVLERQLWAIAEADAALASSLAAIAAADPKFRQTCEANSLPLPK